jgi:membrane-bound lytic murein transglycosylase D
MKTIFFTLSLFFCNTVLLSQSTPVKVTEKDFEQPPGNLLRVIPPPLPDSFILFNERVPLELWDVRERLDKEILTNTYMQGTSLYILKLYTRWMPMIEEELKANNIPDDFKYLCVAESALQNLISRAGATGFWQFMKGSAPGYNLEVNNEVDERYNPQKSTTAACKYLRQAYEKFGSWTAAAASYNCGMGGYSSAATKQGTYNYYNLLLPSETMQYLFRIMALKYILEDPKRSGFMIDADDRYYPLQLKKVVVDHPIPDLVKFAADRNTDYKTLKLLNPWLRSTKLTNKYRKTYTLLLPANSINQ